MFPYRPDVYPQRNCLLLVLSAGANAALRRPLAAAGEPAVRRRGTLHAVDELRLASSREGRLELRRDGSDWWRATLTLPGLAASAKGRPFLADGEHTLSVYFRRLSDDWRGWEGERTWTAIEGSFDLTASHDGLGHVALRVRMRSGLYDDDWTATAVIELRQVARRVAAFDAHQ